MGRVKFVEIDQGAWTPLPENQRLDAYYSFIERTGATELVEAHKDDHKDDPTLIKAEVLGTLPDEKMDENDDRCALGRLRLKLEGRRLEEEVIDENDPPEGAAATTTTTRTTEKPKKKPPKEKRETGDAAMDAAAEHGKSKKRPKTATSKRQVADAGQAVVRERPQSAPARIVRPPIMTYATIYTKEVRGKPTEPVVTVTEKEGSRQGLHNRIIEDVPAPPRPKPKATVLPKKKKEAAKGGRRTYLGGRGGAAAVAPVADDDDVADSEAPEEPEAALTTNNSKNKNNDARGGVVYERVVTFCGAVCVAVEAPTMWSTVRYTTDGSQPTRVSRIYRYPLEIRDRSVTLRLVTVKRGWQSEDTTVRFVHRADFQGVKERMLEGARRQRSQRHPELAFAKAQGPLFDQADPATVSLHDQDEPDALLKAVKVHSTTKVRLLLEASVPANVPGAAVQPLVAAAKAGDTIITQLLLSHGADVNHRDDRGQTALHVACANAAFHCVDLLLHHGADVDAGMDDGRRPLYLACAAGARHCCEYLLAKGAHVDEATADGEHPLYAACRNSAHVDPATTPRKRQTTIEARDYFGVVRLLVDHKANLNAKYKNGRRAITIAERKGREDIVSLLLQAGARPPAAKKEPPGKQPPGNQRRGSLVANSNKPAAT